MPSRDPRSDDTPATPPASRHTWRGLNDGTLQHPLTPHTEVDSLYDGSVESQSEDATADRAVLIRARNVVINFFDRWWWWEISAMSISCASMISLICLLCYLNGMALDDWKFLIQPNSLISVLVTVLKTTMLVPLGACFGQLKWHHFSKGPDSLSRLQLFDEASRGPWGALAVLMQSPRGQSVLAYGLALATITTLSLDAAAQQILSFPDREVFIWSDEAQLSVAEGIAEIRGQSEEPTLNVYSDEELFLRMVQTSVIEEALFGRIEPPFSTCPESSRTCRFPEYKTVGLCSTVVIHGADSLMCTDRNCTLSPDYFISPWTLDFTSDVEYHEIFRFESTSRYTAPISKVTYGMVRMPGHIFDSHRGNFSWYENNEFGTYENLEMEAFEVEIYPCIQKHKAGNFTSSKKQPSRPISTERLQEDFEYTTGHLQLVESSTGEKYFGGLEGYGPGSNGLYSLLNSLPSIRYGFGIQKFTSLPQHGAVTDDAILYIGNGAHDAWTTMYRSDLRHLLDNIALSGSNLIRSKPGEGNTEVRIVYGEALINQTYIRVRWQWATILILETLMVALLLTAVAIATGRRKGALLKSSALGLLYHGIEEWTSADTTRAVTKENMIRCGKDRGGNETDDDDDDGETPGLLGEIAEGMRVQFREGMGLGKRFVLVGRASHVEKSGSCDRVFEA